MSEDKSTSDPFGRAPGEPLIVSVTAPFPPGEQLAELLNEVAGPVEVHFTPYTESREARAARGVNDGVLPADIATPEVDDATLAIWRQTHVVVGIDLPAHAPERLLNLRWFQTVSAGIDHVDQSELAKLGVRLSSASGIASSSLAEFVMARLLEVWKSLRTIEGNQRDQVWSELFGTEVGGRTLLIVGLGSIGREVARRARAFNMTVLATRASARSGDTDPDVDELHPSDTLDSLLPRADAVVCALPTSAATTDLFDADRFDLMKSDAIFCNVGRGTLVVERDLIKTLERGHLRAAVLDVMRNEPLPTGDPLWSAPRTYLSPHSAISLDNYQRNGWAMVAENLERFLAGEPLRNAVQLPPAADGG